MEFTRYYSLYQAGRFVVGGFLGLIMAIVLFSMGETAAGIGLVFFAAGCTALGVLIYMGRRR